MKKFKMIFSGLVCLLNFSLAIAQSSGDGSTCDQAYCNDTGSTTFPSVNTGASMGQWGCLYTTPRPQWSAFNITQSGAFHYVLNQSGGDIDFALYGPYNSLAEGCATINSSTPQVDCSYSSSSTEYVDIPYAQAGQVYILLRTNYSNASSGGTLTPAGSNQTQVNCAFNFSGSATTTSASCSLPNGTASVTPVGGFAPYTITFNIPGHPTQTTFTNVPAGTYTVTGLVPGTYTATITSSPDPSNGNSASPATVSMTVGNTGPTFTATSTPASCLQAANGTATANFANAPAGSTPTYLWNDANAQTTQVATGLAPGAYQVTVSLGGGCTGTASVNVGFGSVSSSATMQRVSCPGGNDGTATVTTTMPGTLSYQWNDASAQTTQIAQGLSAGSYQVVTTSSLGCVSTANITVQEIPGMTATFTNKVDVDCHSKNTGVLTVAVTQGTAPYTYSWDNSASLSGTANDLYVGEHTVTITDNKGCVITRTETLTEPNPLQISFLTPSTQICPEANIDLEVQGIGGNGEDFYTFTWTLNGEVIGTGNRINVDPEVTNTTYCVTLTEECNSPQADSCTLIYFPFPLNPVLNSDKYVDCRPGEFHLTNITQGLQEVATTYIDFGNNTNGILYNGGDTVIVYPLVGTYTLNVINTSIYGCVYDTVLVDFLKVVPDPTARFYLGGNPGTVFETSMTAHDLTVGNIVSWQWSAPDATPSYSNLERPKFTFPENVEGKYPVTLIVTSDYGCSDTTTVEAIIQDVILFFAPTAFTPDGDEFNQTWKLFMRGGDIYGFNLMIFNRWGEVVWETNDASVGWDGTYNGRPVEQGLYNWKASIKHMNDDGKNEYTGHVNLLR